MPIGRQHLCLQATCRCCCYFCNYALLLPQRRPDGFGREGNRLPLQRDAADAAAPLQGMPRSKSPMQLSVHHDTS